MKIYLIFYVLSSVYVVFGYNCTSKDEDLAEGCTLGSNFEKNYRFPINKTTNGDILFLTFYLKVQTHVTVFLIEQPADSKSNENKVTIDITTNEFNISITNGSEKYYRENSVVSPVEWREFWIRIPTHDRDRLIKIGKGGNDTEFMSSNYPNAFHVDYYTITSVDAVLIHGCFNHTLETMRNRIEQYNENTLKCALYSISNHTAPPRALIRQHKMQMNFKNPIDEIIRYTFSNILALEDEMIVTWKDERLAWKPKEQYDRNSVKISIDSIWTPRIEIMSGVAVIHHYSHGDTIVSYDGTISWTERVYDADYAACFLSYSYRFRRMSALTFQANVPFEIHFAEKREPRPPTNYNEEWTITQTLITYKELVNDSRTFWETALDITVKNLKSEKEQWGMIKEMWNECKEYPYRDPPKNPINLTCILEGKYSDLNIEKGIFELEANTRIFWKDERLQWDAVTFNNVTSISACIYDLRWQPQLMLMNDPFLPKYEIIKSNNYANVSSTGQVFYNTHLDMHTNCSNINSGSWPWDMQKCRIDFTIGTGNTSPVTLNFIDKTADYADTTEWKIVKSEVVTSQGLISIEITLKKRSSSMQTELRSIYGVIAVITLSSFWLSPWNPGKTIAKICSLLMLVFFFIFSNNQGPQFTTVAFNFLIGCATLIFTVALSTYLSIRVIRLAREKKSSSPWRFVQDLVNNPIMQSVSCLWINMGFAEQDVTECTTNTSKSETVETSDDDAPIGSNVFANHKKKFIQKDWIKVAVILERLFFLVSFFIVTRLGISLMS